MPSNAFVGHLNPLLTDAEELNDAFVQLQAVGALQQFASPALNRATIVMCISAWEAYVEELAIEAVTALRPAGPQLGVWSALSTSVRSQVGRFNNPNADHVRSLFSDAIGLPDIRASWVWMNFTAAQALQQLTTAINLRHQIAHGVNPRPVIHNQYSSGLAAFFRDLGLATDAAVRDHLVNILGVVNPWPP